MSQLINLKKLFESVIYPIVIFSIAMAYMKFSKSWVPIGIGEEHFSASIYYFEIPIILWFTCLLYFHQIKNRWIRFLLPSIPFILLYALFDIFYNYFSRAPRPSDFENIHSIFDFSIAMGIAATTLFLVFPLSIGILLINLKKDIGTRPVLISIAIRFCIAVIAIFAINSTYFSSIHNNHFKYTVWSQEDTIRENGKFSSFIYYMNEEKGNRRKLDTLSAKANTNIIYQSLYRGDDFETRNIHLIVLESFIDPRLIKNIDFYQSILAKEIEPLLNKDKDFSHVISPIYGGGTAQAEFELLSGIKAMAKVNRIEFNVMKGSPTDSFVRRLSKNGFQSVATIATGTGFFNSRNAYKSIGIDHVSYLQEDEQFEEDYENGYIFDGDVLEHNLKLITPLLKKNKRPLFNYVLGMYGHLPFTRDKEKRPDVIELNHNDERINRISNQFYYRTKAIAKYVKALIALDKNSIIYVTSDHLPSILNQEIKYKKDNKINISLFFDRGNNVDVSGKHFYQIPWLMWDLLQGKNLERNIDDKKMNELYFNFLSQSIAPAF